MSKAQYVFHWLWCLTLWSSVDEKQIFSLSKDIVFQKRINVAGVVTSSHFFSENNLSGVFYLGRDLFSFLIV